MKIGVFDHLDASGRPLGTCFAERLEMLARYDAAGLHAYHLAEHHATPLGIAPSPSLFLAAAMQRTTNLRLGPMVYCLPMYHPVRLFEEICMLDQLSGGRLELGIGRGISPIEARYYGLDPDRMPAMFEETLDLVLAALAAGAGAELSHEGRFHRVEGMPIELWPVQAPHPPLWYGVVRTDKIGWLAERRVNLLSNRPAAAVRPITDAFRAAWRELDRPAAELPLMGITRHVVLAETDAEALAIAERAYQPWRHAFFKLWHRYGAAPPGVVLPETYAGAVDYGIAHAGSPQTVLDRLTAEIEVAGATYAVLRFVFGDMTALEMQASFALFEKHLQPALAAL
jgi:alkanesulfonate monooxygenase SsuD/methylene tetrahydromethanopterin reductase-like flavin-dependent oxidoreductase (luciferase family)